MAIKITIYNDDGNETEHELPSKMEVCYDCEGHGTVMNASMRNHAYSAEEFNESFDDEEDRHAYFHRGGKYDVQCPTCKGANVIAIIDRVSCDNDPILKDLLVQWDKQEEEAESYRAESRAEQRMESMMLGEY
jgi:hypothetical protein